MNAVARYVTYQYTWEYWAVAAVVLLAMGVWLWGVFRDRRK